MTEYVLDTNHVTRLLSGADPLRQRVQAAVTTGDRFGDTMSILGEMYYAAYASQRRDENLQAIRTFLTNIWARFTRRIPEAKSTFTNLTTTGHRDKQPSRTQPDRASPF